MFHAPKEAAAPAAPPLAPLPPLTPAKSSSSKWPLYVLGGLTLLLLIGLLITLLRK
jgi:hypothetical protein